MCGGGCGGKRSPQVSMRQQRQVSVIDTVQLRYLGSDIVTTWQTPTRHTYRVDIQEPVFAVDMTDVKYFMERTERGRPLFAVITTPEPVVVAEPQIEIQAIEPVIEPVIEEISEVEMSVSDEPSLEETNEITEESEKPSRRRKQK